TRIRHEIEVMPVKKCVLVALALFGGLLGSIAPAVGQTSTRLLGADWYDDDEWHLEVRYIITPTELAAYRQLKTADDRERFISRFGAQRDPAPGTGATFRAEFERRVAYADAHFDPHEVPHRGMDTDRGRIYIMFGAPDSTSTFTGGAYEVWRYSHPPLND